MNQSFHESTIERGGDMVHAMVRATGALCSDGVRRTAHPSGDGIADTLFRTPAYVRVGGKQVSGYITVETMQGLSTESPEDPATVKFIAHEYGKNAELLPPGAYKAEPGAALQTQGASIAG